MIEAHRKLHPPPSDGAGRASNFYSEPLHRPSHIEICEKLKMALNAKMALSAFTE